MKSIQVIVALTALLFLSAAQARESFLVLGSFAAREPALNSGKRISEETGLEVLLHEIVSDNGTQYRLLTGVMSDVDDQASLEYQLARVGISDPWLVHFDDAAPFMETVFVDFELDTLSEEELAEIDALLGVSGDEFSLDDSVATLDSVVGDYVVAGSFQEEAKARRLADNLAGLTHTVSVSGSLVNGAMYHRVLIGPVLDGGDTAKSELAAEGITSSWLLRGEPLPVVSEQSSVQIAVPEVRGLKVPAANPQGQTRPIRTERTSWPGDDSDFNLARLKKTR